MALTVDPLADPNSLQGYSPNNTQQSFTGGSYAPPDPTSYTTGGGYTTGGSYTTTPTDPFAAWGGEAAYNALISGYNTQDQQIHASAGDAISNSGTQLNGSILDFLDSQRLGQNQIDNSAVQNELARKSGAQSVLLGVNRGIRSGGVMLANKNAGDSSASQALGNAYGDIGRQQLSVVGNQYAQGRSKIDNAQSEFGIKTAQGARHIQESKTEAINTIVTDTRNKLALLDARIAGANLPNRINIEAEKEQVRADAISRLQQYDQQLATGVAGINPTDENTRMSKALSMFNAGQAPDNAFTFTDQFPAQFQGTGPTAGALPLFSAPKTKQDQLATA